MFTCRNCHQPIKIVEWSGSTALTFKHESPERFGCDDSNNIGAVAAPTTETLKNLAAMVRFETDLLERETKKAEVVA